MEPLCLYGKLTLCSLVLAALKERSQPSSESLLLQAWQHSLCGTLARRSFLPAPTISWGHFPSPRSRSPLVPVGASTLARGSYQSNYSRSRFPLLGRQSTLAKPAPSDPLQRHRHRTLRPRYLPGDDWLAGSLRRRVLRRRSRLHLLRCVQRKNDRGERRPLLNGRPRALTFAADPQAVCTLA